VLLVEKVQEEERRGVGSTLKTGQQLATLLLQDNKVELVTTISSAINR